MSDPALLAKHNPWPHRVAVMLCCATFPLIWVGGLVTTYDAGMAVPDWPSTFGYNLWLYPWSTWFFGPWDLFIEHSHRLLGSLVGLVTITFLVTVYRSPQHTNLRPLAWFALAGVLLQGAVGGARVLLDDRSAAMIHGCLGPSFFAYCAALAVLTSRYWRDRADSNFQRHGWTESRSGVARLAAVTTGLVFLQLLLGAQIRHVSIMAGPEQFRVFVLFHLLVAFALLVHAVLLAFKTIRCRPHVGNLSWPAVSLALLIGLQFVLGPATWIVNYGWPQWLAELPFAAGYTVQAKSLTQAMIVTAHVAVGSLALANAVVVAVRSFKFVRIEATAVGSTAMLVGLAT